MNLKKSIKDYIARPLFEAMKVDTFSRPSLYNLDEKIEKYLNFDNGTFVEIGANDGLRQSNTYYFERMRNWKGVLIEPIPHLYKQCKKLRKRSEVFNYLCSEPKYSGSYKTIRFAGLMSQMSGTLDDLDKEEIQINDGLRVQKIHKSYEVEVECITLSEVINKSSFNNFDFMSIDVEGHEFQVLRGLDLEKHAPSYLLVETWDHEKKEIINYLDSHYRVEDYLTEKDILFKIK